MGFMSSYDLNVAFWNKLSALTYSDMKTLRPDEIFDPKEIASSASVRRGYIDGPDPEFWCFGNGRYVRLQGTYQIDLWMPRKTTSAMKTIKDMSDAHVAHFWPAGGRGLTLTENNTSAHIQVDRPKQTTLGREGAYLREMIEIEFYVEEDPST
jgi:hypothetical protein